MDLSVNQELTPDYVPISAKDGTGVDILIARLEAWLGALTKDPSAPVVTRARHRAGLEAALTGTVSAAQLIKSGAGAELASEEVRLAARALAGLVGEIGVEEVLGAVFSEFCIGK